MVANCKLELRYAGSIEADEVLQQQASRKITWRGRAVIKWADYSKAPI